MTEAIAPELPEATPLRASSRLSRAADFARRFAKRRPAFAHVAVTAASFCLAFVAAMGVAGYVATGGSMTQTASAHQMTRAAPAWRPVFDPNSRASDEVIAPDPARDWNTDLHLLIAPAVWSEDDALAGGPGAVDAEAVRSERPTILSRLDWTPAPEINADLSDIDAGEHTTIADSSASGPYARYREFY